MNDERNLTLEQEKKREELENEIQRLRDIITENNEKLLKGTAEHWEKKKKEIEKQIKTLEDEIENSYSINQSIDSKMKSFSAQSGSGGFPQLKSVRLRDGSQLVINPLADAGTFVARLCIYFSFYDCPFADDANPGSPTAEEEASKDELIKSITGNSTRQKDTANSTTANSGISDWELEAPRQGIVEPTMHSYEWYKRWWKFFRNYSRTNLFLGTEEELNKGPNIALVEYSTNYGDFAYPLKDVPVLIRDNYGTDETKYLQRAREILLNPNRKMNLYDVFVPAQNYLSGVGRVVNPNFSIIELSSYYTYFLNACFPKSSRSTNLLINEITSPSGKKYVLNPEDIRRANFPVLCVDYWTPKDQNKQTLLWVDYDYHGLNLHEKGRPRNKNVKIFNNVVDGVDGPLSVFYELIIDSKIDEEFYKQTGIKRMNPADDRTLAKWFIDRRADFSFKAGDLPGTYKDTSKQEKELRELKDELLTIPYEIHEEERKKLTFENISNQRRINELVIQRNNLIGDNEDSLVKHLVGQAKRIIKDKNENKTNKRQLSTFEDYKNNFLRLQRVARDNLVTADKLKEEDDKYKSFSLTNTEIDAYFADNSKIKAALPEIRQAWKIWDNNVTDDNEKGIWQKIMVPQAKIASILSRHKISFTWDEKQLKTWVENKDNAKIAKDLLKQLDDLAKHIQLDEPQRVAQELIRNSKVAGKELEPELRELLGRRYSPTIFNNWKNAGYGEGTKFHDLINYKTDLREDDKFKTYLKSSDKGGPNLKSDKIDDLIVDKSKNLSDLKDDCLVYLLRYRLNQYIEASIDERKDFKKDTVLAWINEAKALNLQTGDFSDITGGDNKTGDKVLDDFVKSLARSRGEIMGLSTSDASEYRVIQKWMDYKEETIKSLKNGMDEEFLKAENKEAKEIWNTEPKELHKKVRNHQIAKEGITNEEELKKITAKEKDKLERVIELYKDLIDHDLAIPEQKTFYEQLVKHNAALKTTTTPPGEKKPESGGEKKPESGGEKKPESGGESKGKTQETETPWWKKAGYAAIWAPILALILIGGLGYFMGWWGGKKEGGEEEAETTEVETEK